MSSTPTNPYKPGAPAGVGPGAAVLTCANTFLASANAAEYVGATADFADIDPVTRCLSLETLRAAWKIDVKAEWLP